jgi:tripartite-type tricarboxylate transporter receptor subunit TctC
VCPLTIRKRGSLPITDITIPMKKSLTCLFAASLLLASALSHAQAYPAKSVRVMVGFAPGGSTDVTARIMAQELSRLWNQQVVVDNRPGASGMIAAELAAKALPDGYTLLVSPQTSIVVAPLLFPKMPYDSIRDFATVGVVGSSPQLLVIHPSLPPRNFAEFVTFAKANWKQLAYGSGGIGSTPHLGSELLNLSLNIKMVHVPYKGENPALADVLGGQLPLMLSNLPVGLPFARAGKLRGLAITSLERSPIAPEYPTIAESGFPGFDTATWSGLYLPAATPRELVMRVNAGVVRVFSLPEVKQRMLSQGLDYGMYATPEAHAAYVKSEFARWGRVIKDAGVKAE